MLLVSALQVRTSSNFHGETENEYSPEMHTKLPLHLVAYQHASYKMVTAPKVFVLTWLLHPQRITMLHRWWKASESFPEMTTDWRALWCLLTFTISFAICLHSSYLMSIQTLPTPLKEWVVLSQHWLTLSIRVIKSLCSWAGVVPIAFSGDGESHSNKVRAHAW